jgi:hypothetical protein
MRNLALFVRRIVATILLAGPATLAWPHVSAAQEDCRIPGGTAGIGYGDFQNLAPDAAEDLLARRLDCIRAAVPKSEPSVRVVGGHVEDFRNFFDVVRITFNGQSRCTGVLVALDAVLTAGHCGCGAGYRLEVQYKTKPADFAGLIVTDGPIRFPGYRCNMPPDLQPGRDLALFRIAPWRPDEQDERFYNVDLGRGLGSGTDRTLRRQLSLGTIRPAVLVLGNKMLRNLYLVGFGLTENGVLADDMRGAFVGVLSRFCAIGRVYYSRCARYGEFALAKGGLAAGAPVADSCSGDSGGPVFRMDSEFSFSLANGSLAKVSRRTLVGIVSRGIRGVSHPYPGFCGGGGIYTAVGTLPVLSWLTRNGVAFEFTEKVDDADVAERAHPN